MNRSSLELQFEKACKARPMLYHWLLRRCPKGARSDRAVTYRLHSSSVLWVVPDEPVRFYEPPAMSMQQ
jgi:hypothetical protein